MRQRQPLTSTGRTESSPPHAGSLSRAAWLSARNDAFANLAAGGLTAWTRSIGPDLVVGLGIAVMNADAAREVWRPAGREHLRAEA